MSRAPSVDLGKEVQAAARALKPAVTRLARIMRNIRLEEVPPGALADFLYQLRQAASVLGGLSKPLTDDLLAPMIKMTEEHFIKTLAVGESSGVQGHAARVQVSSSPQPVVKAEDWSKFYAWVAKTKQWDLLQRSVSKAAVRERWDNKKQVKFVGVFHAKNVSCTKLGGNGKK